MILTRLSDRRGKITPGMMLIFAAIVIALAAGLFFITRERTEAKKEEHLGEVGRQSTFTMDRSTGVNLPFADQAKPGLASEATTIEVPLDWGKDAKEAAKKIGERFDAIESKLKKPQGQMTYDETLTIVIDRDLEYKTLYQAVAVGQERGFLKFQTACHPKGGSTDVDYLVFTPPVDVAPGKNALLFRVVKEATGELRYIFGTSVTKEFHTLMDAATVLKNTAAKGVTGKILILAPAPDLSVQNAVEALNICVYAGFPTITLNRLGVE